MSGTTTGANPARAVTPAGRSSSGPLSRWPRGSSGCSWTTSSFAAWQQNVLEPLVERRAANLEAKLGQSLGEFIRRVDEVRFELTSVSGRASAESEDISGLERILAGAAGAAMGGVGSAFTGARFGFKSMLWSALPKLGVAVLAVVIGFNPVGLLLALLGADVIRSLMRLDRINQQLKQQVGEAAAEQLPQRADEQAQAVADGVTAIMRELRQGVSGGMAVQLETIREQVRKAQADKSASDTETEQQRRRLGELEQEVDRIDAALDDLLDSVAR